MVKKLNGKRVVSMVIVWAVVVILTLSCLLPLINMIAGSRAGHEV